MYISAAFLRTELPSASEAWNLPSGQIPHLTFSDGSVYLPRIHDDGYVKDWKTWYEWRQLDVASPVALRMDMVLTTYYLLTKVLGVVDVGKKASQSRRRIVVHILGAVKELNVIPLCVEMIICLSSLTLCRFAELALLIPNADIVLTFFGPSCKKLYDIARQKYPGSLATKPVVFEYIAPASLGGSTVTAKLDRREHWNWSPSEGDKPDALIGKSIGRPCASTSHVLAAQNAGLFAYMTWQIVYRMAARWGIT
jgi:hypothetical protein